MSDNPGKLARDVAEHLRFLAESGVTGVPVPHLDTHANSAGGGAGQESLLEPASPAPGSETVEAIAADLGPCTRCKLHPTRQKIVFGVGSPRARLMFVGEAPGADEDRLGEPFVGRAGKLLDRIIQAMGLNRDEVYIANVLKCRPPNNRNPEEDEIAACSPFLFRQIAAIAPQVLVALGAPAAKTLLDTQAPIGRLRGKFWLCHGVDLMPTYHPAYLLRNPAKKREVWEDMQQVMERLGLEPAKGRD
jgi:DNA polymerase